MILLKSTNIITKYKCKIQVSEKKDNHLNVCLVKCSGRNKWTHLFPSVYQDYAMLHATYLFDLPGKAFIVYQINEHSRGGHVEYEMQLLDINGNVLNQFAGSYNSKIILDDKYLWFLVSGEEPFNFNTDRDLNLIKLNFKTGKTKQSIKLNYPHLLNCSYNYILGASLSIKHNKGILQIKYSDNSKETQSKRVELKNI